MQAASSQKESQKSHKSTQKRYKIEIVEFEAKKNGKNL